MAPGAINRNAVSPPAQGWRFGYPGIADEQSFNRKAVASCSQRIRAGRNRQAVGINELSTQGSRSGNPGLKAATALRFAAIVFHLRLALNSKRRKFHGSSQCCSLSHSAISSGRCGLAA